MSKIIYIFDFMRNKVSQNTEPSSVNPKTGGF